MTMTAIMFAGDDEDVVESSVRHNLHHVDAIFVVGLDSRDGTGRIVERIASEGLPVAWSAARHDATRRSFAHATLRQLVQQDAVRHVLLLGADTFLEGPPGRLRDAVLANPDAVHLLPRRVRVPTEGDDWAEPDPYLRLVHTRMLELDQRFVAVVPHPLFAETSIAADCLFREDDAAGAVVGAMEAVQLPVRNAWQFTGLVATRVRELALESTQGLPDRRERVRYWMRMGEIVRGRSLLSPDDLRSAAATFEADDPAPIAQDHPRPFAGHALRYLADSASALDHANGIIADMHRAEAARAAAPASL